ncbi:excinuclease ABC subunit B [Candidatus Campbellbacteria bacterium RIFCSPLOWO2_01_FULL_34_15]|uniref:UvrABC system protein B n=1 Tax=Candidatus Campbellbacteria bacterium RIFCSPLOWO2_01_FULL_34_15 TaxID=1797579 RepID=A0A1F5ENG7_9BACT|nr:MAG: excinuclease ABC subunit B [Candidatus Campbellbacteria bacterium RIFCSPLOWO2_01_FULL_34_15]
MKPLFKLHSEYEPAGDQEQAIESLMKGLKKGERHQTLLGVTGSGKTFTVANMISKINKPTLVITHNKTLAAQLAQEYKEFFPENAVHYFVSYYDYYQPEAYVAVSDTYIEKEASINAEVERLRHATTQSLLTRKDVIVVATVSCIYGLGNPTEYEKIHLKIKKGEKINQGKFIRDLIALFFERTNADLEPGKFRVIGNAIEIMPVNEKQNYRIQIDSGVIDSIQKIDPVSQIILEEKDLYFLFPAKHFITNPEKKEKALKQIEKDLEKQLKKFEKEGKLLEADRIKRRTKYDIALMKEIGYVSGIENYSRYFDERKEGEPPYTLLDYFPEDFLTVIDESHVAVPQIGGMYAGDRSRKNTLVEYGFRLPSAKDNRPLTFEEFEKKIGQVVYTSATPGIYEMEHSTNIAEQIIRPTGLVDPQIVVKPIQQAKDHGGQVQDFIAEAEKTIAKGGRVLATTLTKKMAEDLSEYLDERGIKSVYIHSDIGTVERIDIITDFRKGKYDILVGVNLLREGLDMPEVVMIGILDADKEGFLRSATSLIQTIGRAARNVDGRVILYADHITKSMQKAIEETDRRRKIQIAYNEKHGITPKTISKKITSIADQMRSEHEKIVGNLLAVDLELMKKNPKRFVIEKKRQMDSAVKILDFETAAILRDEIRELEKMTNKPKNSPALKSRKTRGK